jgi:lipid A 4'-phosphatase
MRRLFWYAPLVCKGPQVRVIIAVLAAVAAAVTVAMLLGVDIDLRIAALFYDPSSGKFLLDGRRPFWMVRENGIVALTTCIAAVVAGLVVRVLRLPERIMPGRVVLFFVTTLVLGPGLLVNGILKEHWNRPRPAHVTQFGGKEAYVNWWNPTGTCDHNCSFVSGEASSAAWMFAPAMLAPPQWRVAAYVGAGIFTAAISIMRMAAGRHFFTDVLFAALLMLVLIWGMRRLIFRVRAPAAKTR